MEGVNRHLMTLTHEAAQHREGAAENGPSGWDMPRSSLPEQDQGADWTPAAWASHMAPSREARAGNPVASTWVGLPGLAGLGD